MNSKTQLFLTANGCGPIGSEAKLAGIAELGYEDCLLEGHSVRGRHLFFRKFLTIDFPGLRRVKLTAD